MGVIQIRLLGIKQLSLSIGIGSSHIHLMPPFPRFADKQCEVPQVLSAIPLRYLVQCQRINNLPALKQEQHSRPETYENELCR